MRISLPSFAKVNLHLQVVGRRSDGFHELRTLFQTIDLHDDLEVDLATAGCRLEVTGAALASGRDNLVRRAAEGFLARWGAGRGVVLRLRKRIPIGAGLGGGSSNAATTLLALRQLLGAPRDAAELWGLARELSADVPYFLTGGTALGVGRGDEVVPLPELRRRRLWLIVPPFPISTPAVFARLEATGWQSMAPGLAGALGAGRLSWRRVEGGWNDLQAAAFQEDARLLDMYNAARRAGARWVRLSGSGGVLVSRFAGDPPESVLAGCPRHCRLVPVTTLSRAAALRWRRAVAAGRQGGPDEGAAIGDAGSSGGAQ